MDFIDGLPKSNGYEVILVVVDSLSKYGHFLPLKHSHIAQSVAKVSLIMLLKYMVYLIQILVIKDVFLSSFWQELFTIQGYNSMLLLSIILNQMDRLKC